MIRPLTNNSPLRCNNYALSASPLSHAETPRGLAFFLYPAFSCGVQRNSTRAVAGFLMGGLPLGRLGLSILDILPVQIILDKRHNPLYSVRTLNTEADMDYSKKTSAELNYILKDAREAANNMRGFDAKAEAKYLDQINDACTELARRMKRAA